MMYDYVRDIGDERDCVAQRQDDEDLESADGRVVEWSSP